MRKPHPTLTPQELAIMKVVWRKDEATVRDVCDALNTGDRLISLAPGEVRALTTRIELNR